MLTFVCFTVEYTSIMIQYDQKTRTFSHFQRYYNKASLSNYFHLVGRTKMAAKRGPRQTELFLFFTKKPRSGSGYCFLINTLCIFSSSSYGIHVVFARVRIYSSNNNNNNNNSRLFTNPSEKEINEVFPF